jgi:hypothetical protein
VLVQPELRIREAFEHRVNRLITCQRQVHCITIRSEYTAVPT